MSDYDDDNDNDVVSSDDGPSPSNRSNDSDSSTITFDDGRDRTLSSREAERRQLQEDMAKYLNSGGKIQEIERNVRRDPPRKPESNYGSRPI